MLRTAPILLLVILFSVAGSAQRNIHEIRSSTGAVTLYEPKPVPAMFRLGVIGFRDCINLDHVEDCQKSGDMASLIYATAFAERKGTTVSRIPRGLDAFTELTDTAAVELGKAQALDYVLTGEVLDYSSVAAFSGRGDRASFTVRLLRVTDGALVAEQTEKMVGGSNFSNPQRLLKTAAERFQKTLPR